MIIITQEHPYLRPEPEHLNVGGRKDGNKNYQSRMDDTSIPLTGLFVASSDLVRYKRKISDSMLISGLDMFMFCVI